VFTQDGANNTAVGVTKESFTMTPIEDVTRLFEVSRIARKVESDAARSAKKLTAQRILYDLTEGKEDPTPTPEFERAAIDAFAAGEILESNRSLLNKSKPKTDLEILAKAFLLGEITQIFDLTLQWVKDMAAGKANLPRSHAMLLKDNNVAVWVYSKLLNPIPTTTLSWMSMLFPKDGNRGIKMTQKEYLATTHRSVNATRLFVQSQVVYDLVNKLGSASDKRDDIEMSYPLIPIYEGLERLAQSRLKPTRVNTVSKSLATVLNVLYDMSRAILPFDEKNRKKALELLFKDPSYLDNVPENPIQQVIKHNDQEFLFWKMKPEHFEIALKIYGIPITVFEDCKDEVVKTIQLVPLPKENLEPYPVNPPRLLKPSVSKDDLGFQQFQRTLEARNILQYSYKEKQRKSVATFVPDGQTATLLMLVKHHKYFRSVVNDVEIFLNSFKNETIRTAAAKALHAALVGIDKPTIYTEFSKENFEKPFDDNKIDEEESVNFQDDDE